MKTARGSGRFGEDKNDFLPVRVGDGGETTASAGRRLQKPLGNDFTREGAGKAFLDGPIGKTRNAENVEISGGFPQELSEGLRGNKTEMVRWMKRIPVPSEDPEEKAVWIRRKSHQFSTRFE